VFYSFPALSCEFASVDVSDVLGTVSLNLCVPCYFFLAFKVHQYINILVSLL
jgi:hypothetical protein